MPMGLHATCNMMEPPKHSIPASDHVTLNDLMRAMPCLRHFSCMPNSTDVLIAALTHGSVQVAAAVRLYLPASRLLVASAGSPASLKSAGLMTVWLLDRSL